MPKNPPVALILFSNDLDRFLPMVESERKIIEEALESYNDTNRLKVITRSSVSVDEVFRLFSRYQGRISMFHFAGHANGQGLQFNKNFKDNEQGKAVGLADLFRREVENGILQLVFLNGCSTRPQLDLLKEAGVPSVISTRHPIGDRKAVAFARQFYRTLANSDQPDPFQNPATLQQAFDQGIAYLKTSFEVKTSQNNRDLILNFWDMEEGSTEESQEPWTLYTTNPEWTLSAEVAAEDKPFNELLTLELIHVIAPYRKSTQKFLSRADEIPGWESISQVSDKAKEIIAYSFVGILGIQLRKLFAIGKNPHSDQKKQEYLNNCGLTGKRILQLLCFSLLSGFWDHQKEKNHTLTDKQRNQLNKFFEDEFELDIQGYLDLLGAIYSIFTDHQLEFPIREMAEFAPNLDQESHFTKACLKLQEINIRLEKSKSSLADCFAAERQLTAMLSTLHYLAGYKMISVKNIAYNEMRNAPPRYLHNYAALGIDTKSNINTERVNYAEMPVTTDAILLFSGGYQQEINFFPFIIDVNALTFEGGTKVCFYSCRDLNSRSLNYRFVEDNSLERIEYTQILTDETQINEIMMDDEKYKAFKLDFVYQQFQEAKKTILQEMGDAGDDFWEEEEDEIVF